jgi:hypothetical protein
MKAYPYIHKHPTTGNTTMADGMDLRDYFAARAMQGLIASPRGTPDGSDATDEYYAKCAYIMADAMMKAREVKNEHS